MKFIWLITIFLICLSLCFYFLCCNTSLLAQPAFIQCLADSHFGQREDSHKTPHRTEPCRQSQQPPLKPDRREEHHSKAQFYRSCSLPGAPASFPFPQPLLTPGQLRSERGHFPELPDCPRCAQPSPAARWGLRLRRAKE